MFDERWKRLIVFKAFAGLMLFFKVIGKFKWAFNAWKEVLALI